MSYTSQSLIEMASNIQAKDVISFSLNTEFLNQNFTIIKQCLIKIQQLQGSLGQQKESSRNMTFRLKQIENNITHNQNDIKVNADKIRELQNNVGDDFMKRMYGIQEKTKNMFTFDDTVSKLEALNKFVTLVHFKENDKQIHSEIEEIKKIRNQFQRYVPVNHYEQYKDSQRKQQLENEREVIVINEHIDRLSKQLSKTNQIVSEAYDQVKENTKMIKEINFAEMMDKLKKFKDDQDQKICDLIMKMKKKIGGNQLVAFEQTMIQKLDKFLTEGERNKAEKMETRQALIFLEKRISDIQDIFAQKSSEDEKDALFSVKKWQCASCTKDLGKFEGKLGQYKPWSVFPCKELDPEKIGGFGYMSYLDKISGSSKKNLSSQEQATERLNKTAYEKDRDASPKRGSSTARTSNVISNYGFQQKGSISLKDMYFRDLKSEKGDRTKFFRVKKDIIKTGGQSEKIKQV